MLKIGEMGDQEMVKVGRMVKIRGLGQIERMLKIAGMLKIGEMEQIGRMVKIREIAKIGWDKKKVVSTLQF
jgi:UDP-3-O-[3-hydroxymyristoyl] glucosamine N-acyltransferase